MVFIEEESEEGERSYHFSTEGSYISYAKYPSYVELSNGESLPAKKYFSNETYEADSRTFRGTIVWTPLTFYGVASWEYTLNFDEDFTKITAKSTRLDKNEEGEVIATYNYGTYGLNYRRKRVWGVRIF